MLGFFLDMESPEDSMIGGEEDDLEDILEELGSAVERPNLIQRVATSSSATGPLEETRPLETSEQAPRAGHSRDNKLADSIERLVTQNNELLKLVAERQERPREEGSGAKRKVKDEVYDPEEPVLLLMENYKIEDDGHYTMDTKLRQMIRPINIAPEEYWTKDAFKRVDRPILGNSLYLEHLMNGDVHPGTLYKSYDRGLLWRSRIS